MVLRILNLEGHHNCMIGSKVMTILPKELLGQQRPCEDINFRDSSALVKILTFVTVAPKIFLQAGSQQAGSTKKKKKKKKNNETEEKKKKKKKKNHRNGRKEKLCHCSPILLIRPLTRSLHNLRKKGVLNCHRQTNRETDGLWDSMTEFAQGPIQ